MVEMVESGETQELEPPQALETKLITLESILLLSYGYVHIWYMYLVTVIFP